MKKLLAIIAMLVAVPVAAAYLGAVSSTELGLSSATLASTPTSSAVALDLRTTTSPFKAHYDNVLVVCSVTWGTSPSLLMSFLESGDGGTTYAPKKYCSGTSTKTCVTYYQQYESAAGTTISAHLATQATHFKIQLDDPTDGTGTATCTVKMGGF